MFKKIVLFGFIFVWISTPFAHAWRLAPYLNITVNENAIGGDDSFGFHIRGGNPGTYFTKNFNIQTNAGFGTDFTGGNTGGGDTYVISQNPLVGWNNVGIICTSDNPSISVSYGSNIAIITAYPYSSIICSFTNIKGSSKTPVLIIPGVLGTNIIKGNEKLWLDLGHNLTDVGDEFMDPLQFQTSLSPLDSSLVIGEVIGKPSILFDYSDGLIQEFKNQNYTQGSSSTDSLFLFPYDWRYGVTGKYANGSTTVDLLRAKIQEIRDQTHSDKVDVIAHSTGGLLVKKYVMDHPTDSHIGKAVFVGVPNTGAPKAIKTLLVGDSFGNPGLADSEMQKIAQNLPVVYDLSPSQQYFNAKGSYIKIINQGLFSASSQDLDFNQANSFLTNDHKANAQALLNSQNLHTLDFDNYDMRTGNVDVYSIDGCKAGTISKVIERRLKDIFGGINISYDQPQESPGDGTVPLESSTNLPINQSNKYYALKANHGKMPSQEGIRQQIVNIISGSNLSVSGNDITQDIAKCKLNGKAISVYSPLSIDIIDQDGNHSGLLSDGVSIQNDIPNADFEVMGEHKFVYLPNDEGQTYTINVKGTDNGTFTIKDQDISNNQVQQTQVFSNLPVTPDLTGQVNLGSGDNQTTLSLKTTSTSAPIVVTPSSVVNGEQSQDLTPPVSTSTIIGAMGDIGFYRSDVKINLLAQDLTVEGNASTTSGVLKTQYSLDNQSYQDYNTSTPVTVTTEGQHSISFFSTDRAGNNEEVQSVGFVIDKTVPEFVIQFNQSLQDLQFTATDTLPTILYSTSTPNKVKFTPKVKVIDQDNIITATDSAGNTSQIILKDKNRKKALKAEIQSLTYNNQPVDISKTVLKFNWSYDKSNILKTLEQHIKSKKDFNIDAVYKPNSTQLTGKDQSGKINKALNGLTLLKVTTSLGDFGWGY